MVVAGEESGDLLGAAIARAALRRKELALWGCGGKRLKATGMQILYDTAELSTIGFWEAAKNYFRLRKIMNLLARKAKETNTQHAWLIDFPGFNLLLAKKLKALGVRCSLVVSPTVWAWKYRRVYKIRERFERVLCLYDFEPAIYAKIGVEAHYIGHPIARETELLQKKLRQHNPLTKNTAIAQALRSQRPIIAVLPGSRPSEIAYHTAPILGAIRLLQQKHPQFVFAIPAANAQILALLERYPLPPDTVLVPYSAPYVLALAEAAIACSGTVTLECALFGVPHLILYRSSWLSYAIFKMVIRIPYIGMVNVLAGKFIAQEYLQHRLTPANLAAELERLLFDKKYRACQKKNLLPSPSASRHRIQQSTLHRS